MKTPSANDSEFTAHPEPALLAAFLDGRLAEHQRLEVESHVAECETCCNAMSKLPLDPLSARLRDFSEDAADADDSDWSVVTDPGLSKSSQPNETETHALPAELQGHPRYRILEPLGRGGMGVVYKAQHRLMDRIVALKVIDSRLMDNPQMIDRFRNEVKAAALLTHANIVRAYDAEQAGSLHFLVMEYVDGISLAELVRRKGPLAVDQALGVVRKVAHGLQHAFQHGMVHRDIKPQNIMVTRTGKVRILDFGLARFARERDHSAATPDTDPYDVLQRTADSLTLAGSILGTPDYIAPEQVMDARQADTRADIYSLGCTCYFLLTGRPPFPDGTALQKLMAHRDQTPTSVTRLRKDVSPQFARLIQCMMARDPSHRLQTPLEVVTAIDELNSVNTLSTTDGPSQAKPNHPASLRPTDAAIAPSVIKVLPTIKSPTQAVVTSEINSSEAAAQPATPGNAKRDRRLPRKTTGLKSWTRPFGVTLALLVLGTGGVWIGRDILSESELFPEAQNADRPSISRQNDESTGWPAKAVSRRQISRSWVELIPEIDPVRDSFVGVWRKADGELVAEATEGARLVLPVEVPAEYDFDIEFTRHNGVHSIALIFAANGGQATFDIDAWGRHVAGIQNIAGQSIQPSSPNSTMVPGQELVNGQRYSAEVRVRHDSVQAWLNGQLLTTYHGDGSDLSLIPEWQLPVSRPTLAIGAYESSTTFHRIRVRAVPE